MMAKSSDLPCPTGSTCWPATFVATQRQTAAQLQAELMRVVLESALAGRTVIGVVGSVIVRLSVQWLTFVLTERCKKTTGAPPIGEAPAVFAVCCRGFGQSRYFFSGRTVPLRGLNLRLPPALCLVNPFFTGAEA